MIRKLVIGYCLGSRSERRLCDEVHLNLAHRWFCRLGLEDRVPDHPTFSKNRHGCFLQSDAFRLGISESVTGVFGIVTDDFGNVTNGMNAPTHNGIDVPK